MNSIEDLAAELKVNDVFTDNSGVKWFTTGNLDIRELVILLGQEGARFITITATELPMNQGFCLEYLWDLNGKLLGFPFYPTCNTMPSIYDICEAADWIEREIHEEFSIEFTGRVYEPLLLRENDHTGVNLHEVAK
ncbi:NADH-quinone oxidoreductase subunit C [Telmatobacter sp. DSM 110680]|uniref:NADH-quinone oxidoreductase subunit C n=1 Tax=Telmatobacter sp. DSM 110680 TaxID=3036704 RepID=A0AAU7DJ64_9BACT